jgi:acyl carrier protein
LFAEGVVMRALPVAVQYSDVTHGTLLQAVLSMWQEVLECRPGQLDADSNFFLNGGDSLQLTRVLVRVRERLGVQLDLRDAARFSTARKMAECVHAAAALQPVGVAADHGVFTSETSDRFRASEGQAALWLAEQMAEGTGLYNTAVMLRLSGGLHIPVLAMALNLLLQRHEMLRTRLQFDTHAQQLDVVIDAQQQVRLDAELPDCVDPHEYLREHLRDYVCNIAGRPFVLARGPLWRFHLLNTGKQSWALLLCLHHCISDGWSGPVLLRSLAGIYNALLRDPHWTPPAPEREFRAYALREQRQVHTDVSWWRSQLAGDLPSWPQTGTSRWPFAIAHAELALPQSSIGRAQQAASLTGVQLSAFLLTALRLALRSLTGIAEFCIGLPATVRTTSAQENAVGYFVNLLVLRECIAPGGDMLQLLRQVQHGLDAALVHRAVPFPVLVRTLAPPTLPSGNSWCDILFAFQNSPQVIPWFSGMTVDVEALPMPYAQHPLKVEILKSSGAWICRVEYARDIFKPGEIQRLLAFYNYYIAQLAAAIRLEQ